MAVTQRVGLYRPSDDGWSLVRELELLPPDPDGRTQQFRYPIVIEPGEQVFVQVILDGVKLPIHERTGPQL